MATNYGLISGMAQGLDTALTHYQTMKQAQDRDNLQALQNGVQKDSDGNWTFTPEKQLQNQQQQQMIKKQNEMTLAKYDPMSSYSQAQRGLIAKMGTAVPDNMSGAEAEGLLKPSEYLGTNDLKSKISDQNNQTRTEIAELRRQMADSGQDAKAKKSSLERFNKLSLQLDPNGLRAGNMGASQKLVNQSERIEGIFKQFPDGNIPAPQQQELATAVASLYSGGSPQSQHQIDAIVPSSMKGDANKWLGWFTNNPRGAEQQKFVKILQESSEREKAIAKKQVLEAQAARLGGFEDLYQADPDHYRRIIRQHMKIDPTKELDEYGGYVPGTEAPPANVKAAAPKPGAIEDGHRFKGGDPADPKNWEKL